MEILVFIYLLVLSSSHVFSIDSTETRYVLYRSDNKDPLIFFNFFIPQVCHLDSTEIVYVTYHVDVGETPFFIGKLLYSKIDVQFNLNMCHSDQTVCFFQAC
jgi:hypothetical protein